MNKRNPLAVPDLPVKEITSYFSEVDVEIAPSDILRPTAATTQRIYEQILQLLEGPSPGFADESQQVVYVVQKMAGFLQKIGIRNFSIRDLNPDSRRLIEILSTIINFTMFRDNKQHVYERVSRIADDNFRMRKALEEKIRDAENEIVLLENRLREEAEKKLLIEAEIERLEKELRDFYKHQKDKASEVALLKAEKTEISDKLCSCQLLEHNLQQEIVCLRAQIVSDPGKLVELVREMRDLIEREKETLRETEKAMTEKTGRIARIEKVSALLQKVQMMRAEVEQFEEKIGKMEQTGVLNESKLKNIESAISAVKIRIGHIERQISHLESKIYNLQNSERQSSQEISEKMSKLKLKYEDVSEERAKMMERVKCNNELAQSLLKQQLTAQSDFDRDCSDTIGALVQLSGEVSRYFSLINNCF